MATIERDETRGNSLAAASSDVITQEELSQWLRPEPEPTPEEILKETLAEIKRDSATTHLTPEVFHALIAGSDDVAVAKVTQPHLNRCQWCCGALRDALRLSSVPPAHHAWTLLWQCEQEHKLNEFRKIKKNWDDDGAERPSDDTLKTARRVLALMAQAAIRPARIAPSVEGGVMFSFFAGERYGDMELFNTGTIFAVVSQNNGNPRVWEVSDDDQAILEALKVIRDHVA